MSDDGKIGIGMGGALDLDRRDLLFWALTFGLAVLVAVAVYTAAFSLPAGDYRFSGFLLNSHDAWTYPAWARSFAGGGLLADNPWAPARRPPAYFNLVWFAVGKMMRFTGLPFLAVYYAFGLAAGAAMYLFLLALMKAVLRDGPAARCAYLMAGFGSGFGWLVHQASPDFFRGRLLGNDLVNLDGFPFSSFLAFPHLSFSGFLFLAVVLGMYRRAEEGGGGWLALACVAALAMGFAHPYHLVTLSLVAAAWHLALRIRHGRARPPRWRDLLLLGLFMVPGIAYYRALTGWSPNFSFWESQNVTRTLGLRAVVIGFAPFLALALLGLSRFIRARALDDRHLLVVLWLAVNFGLNFSYPLVYFEARMSQGLIFPLAALAAWGLFGTAVPAARPRRAAWAAALLVATVPTHFLWVSEQMGVIRGLGSHPVPDGIAREGDDVGRLTRSINTGIVLHREQIEAMEFLGNARGTPLVLSSGGIGLVLPAFAPVKAYLGHSGLTPDYDRKRRTYARFFYWPRTTGAERRAILAGEGIDYVWFGPEELSGGKFDPVTEPCLRMVFRNGLYRIYRIDRRALGGSPGGA